MHGAHREDGASYWEKLRDSLLQEACPELAGKVWASAEPRTQRDTSRARRARRKAPEVS